MPASCEIRLLVKAYYVRVSAEENYYDRRGRRKIKILTINKYVKPRSGCIIKSKFETATYPRLINTARVPILSWKIEDTENQVRNNGARRENRESELNEVKIETHSSSRRSVERSDNETHTQVFFVKKKCQWAGYNNAQPAGFLATRRPRGLVDS